MRILGHPVRPMLIVYPIGMFTMAVIFDILYLITRVTILSAVAFDMIAAGVPGGLALLLSFAGVVILLFTAWIGGAQLALGTARHSFGRRAADDKVGRESDYLVIEARMSCGCFVCQYEVPEADMQARPTETKNKSAPMIADWLSLFYGPILPLLKNIKIHREGMRKLDA